MLFRSFVNGEPFSAVDVVTLENAITHLIHTPAILENLDIDFLHLYASSVVDGNIYEIRGELPSVSFSHFQEQFY